MLKYFYFLITLAFSTEIKDEVDETIEEEEIQLPEFIDADQYSQNKNESSSDFESNSEAIKSKPQQKISSNYACKYCETGFVNKNELWMHFCEYLQCDDPENYLCRVCHREIKKSCFNSHHEVHISNAHRNESYVPPKKRNMDEYLNNCDVKSSDEGVKKLSPINQLMRRKGVRTKIKYARKNKQRYECDLCGKYLVSLRSLQFHMNLHRGDSSYICASCGLQFYTPNGNFHVLLICILNNSKNSSQI
jgi:hypothetical protein